MKETTQVYIIHDDKVLLMLRNKKKNDMNEGKWIAPGGKFEESENAFECAERELLEETGIRAYNLKKRGEILFCNDRFEDEIMHLFVADEFEKEKEPVSDEGHLQWIEKKNVKNLPMWEGDKLFIDEILNDDTFIEMTLNYSGYELKNWTRR